MSAIRRRWFGVWLAAIGTVGCADISYPTRLDLGYGANRTPDEERVHRLEKQVEKLRKEKAELQEDIAKLERKLNIR